MRWMNHCPIVWWNSSGNNDITPRWSMLNVRFICPQHTVSATRDKKSSSSSFEEAYRQVRHEGRTLHTPLFASKNKKSINPWFALEGQVPRRHRPSCRGHLDPCCEKRQHPAWLPDYSLRQGRWQESGIHRWKSVSQTALENLRWWNDETQ